ncbi:MAG: hypothetical protein IJX89_00025 [Alphaproteobacteria bacterium]|nr:hypothetical protein [Alphaproteobacteria bacterium]
MANTKKPVSLNVIHILKSIVDYKTPALHRDVNNGIRAEQELPVICEYISNLNQYIINNRYDREASKDAEEDLADYEYQASGIQAKINRGKIAQEQLAAAQKFNATYNTIVRSLAKPTVNLSELIAQRNELEAQLFKLDDRISACEINMNPGERGHAIAAQAKSDMADYIAKYNELDEKYRAICHKINTYTR